LAGKPGASAVRARKRHGLRTKIRKPRAVKTSKRQAISENQITQALSLYSGTVCLGYLLPQSGRFVAFDIAGNHINTFRTQAEAAGAVARAAGETS
jgi:hypothetical protein